MAFDRKRRLKLAAITGAVPFVLFLIPAFLVDEQPTKGLIVAAIGAFIGLALFGMVAITKPSKDDE